MSKPTFNPKRHVSWSCLSSWEWNKDEWYDKYVLGNRTPPSAAMLFGNVVGESLTTDKPMVKDIITHSHMEYKLTANLGDITLLGYVDTYCPKTKSMREYKTSQSMKRWSQKSTNEHGQITMYALMLHLQDKVHPDDLTIHLDHIPTITKQDFTVALKEPITVNSYKTVRTMGDILRFAAYIQKTHKEMCKFIPTPPTCIR